MGKEIIKLDHIDVVFNQKKQDIRAVEDVTIQLSPAYFVFLSLK